MDGGIMTLEIVISNIIVAALATSIVQIAVRVVVFQCRKEPIEPWPADWPRGMKLFYHVGQIACGLIGVLGWSLLIQWMRNNSAGLIEQGLLARPAGSQTIVVLAATWMWLMSMRPVYAWTLRRPKTTFRLRTRPTYRGKSRWLTAGVACWLGYVLVDRVMLTIADTVLEVIVILLGLLVLKFGVLKFW